MSQNTRQSPQIFQTHGGLQNFQTLARLDGETLKFPHKLAIGECFSALGAVAKDHGWQ